MKKFEMTSEFTITGLFTRLYRIKALRSFGNVAKGDLGGFVEKEANLDQYGNSWIFGDAKVHGNAKVSENATVSGSAEVSENARVYGSARVCGNANVYQNAKVFGNATVHGNSVVCGKAKVFEISEVGGNARVSGCAELSGDVYVSGNAELSGNAKVSRCLDYATVKGFGRYCRETTFYREKDNKIYVGCGCFRGDLEEFRKKVKENHGDSKYAKEYLMIADLMEMHFKEGDNDE